MKVVPKYSGCDTGLHAHEVAKVDFKAFQKISLLDFPGRVAAIVWVGGCNFRCPFCYNRDLVVNPDSLPSISEMEF
jgi:uncharacterized Fe-S radical SAM superfamily protein PflX